MDEQLALERARQDLSLISQLIEAASADGGCTATGGVHTPDELCGAVAEGLKLAQEVARRRDGGGQLVPGLETHISQLAAAARGTPVATMKVAANAIPFDAVVVGEAAELARCGTRWVRHLARQGRIRSRKAGRDWLIDRQAAVELGRSRDRGA